MSAIFGLVRLGGAASEADLARMQRSLVHRGPDGQASLALGPVGLGHCLLRVNHEDRLEAQPLHDRDLGVTLVADLRLDNREELAQELGITPDRLGGMPDSAVVLEAWRRWGPDCLDRLLGDFALALWDHRAQRLHLARDGMGQRGLYLHHGPGLIAFASEAKALWTVEGVPRRLNDVGLASRLLGPVDPAPDVTLFEGITVLPGGHLHIYDAAGQLEVTRFWEPRADPRHLGQDDAYYLSAYRQVVKEAIACRVRRLDHPPMLMFSGGFDSGTIAAIAAPYAVRQGKAVLAVASVLPEGEGRPTADARRAASAFRNMPGIDLRWYARRDEHHFMHLEQGFAELDDCQPHDYVRRSAYVMGHAAGARLALDGHGGDYTVNHLEGGLLGQILLSGDLRRFVRELRARRRRHGRGLVWILTYEVARPLLPVAMLRAALALRRGLTPLWQLRFSRDDFAARMIAAGRINPRRLRDPYVVHGRWAGRWRHMLQRMGCAAPMVNNLAAQAGLDFSRPYHDRRVVELGLAIPERLYLKDGLERWLARNALADVLPQQLIDSPPGNVSERPGLYAMLAGSAPAALAELQTEGQGAPAARAVDYAKLERALANPGDENAPTTSQLAVIHGATALVIARFVNWFERQNARNQEP
ncbi:asparagine synthetase B family protein [Novosphingobium sp. B 225]|uniref:asparagine synthetase B family protein n=1 Tax=Novosphingobium sp. B 225 TaxID=1961849 RepID=UPI000B4B3A96|nr:asparagine synthase-related protein [Novosphingobium sp. B 225]